MNIFIDTSAFFAVLDKRDKDHSAADRIGIRTAFVFDSDFKAQGFDVLS